MFAQPRLTLVVALGVAVAMCLAGIAAPANPAPASTATDPAAHRNADPPTVDEEQGRKLNDLLILPSRYEFGNRDRFRRGQRVPENVRAIRDLEYARVDGHRLTLDLYLPRMNPPEGGAFPLIVWIHGGGWLRGSKDQFPGVKIVGAGFVVASINYRTSDEAVFPAQLHDAKAAIRWLRANARDYSIDAGRIGAWGPSTGGHLAALLGTSSGVKECEGEVGAHFDQPSSVQAVCDWYAPTDLVRLLEGADDADDKDNPVFALLGGPPADKAELYARANPATHASADDPAFLIMHGEDDDVVPLDQSRLLEKALKAVKVSVRVRIVEGAGHGFTDVKLLDEVAQFFRETLARPARG